MATDRAWKKFEIACVTHKNLPAAIGCRARRRGCDEQQKPNGNTRVKAFGLKNARCDLILSRYRKRQLKYGKKKRIWRLVKRLREESQECSIPGLSDSEFKGTQAY